MKTLDEVIDNFEKACDLERRCEGCSGCLGQEYGCPNDGAECVPDALHYLKVLKDILDPLKVKKNSHEITCPWCQSKIAILLPESNEPLTWDELKQMEGKPVWIEFEKNGNHWLIITDIKSNGAVGRGVYGENAPLYKDRIGTDWQAYRKERE